MAYIFRPPIRDPQGPRVTSIPDPQDPTDFPQGPQLLKHVHHHGGYPVTVTVTGGVVEEHPKPTTDVLRAADEFYLGGHDSPVTEAEKAVLEAAGYEVLEV